MPGSSPTCHFDRREDPGDEVAKDLELWDKLHRGKTSTHALTLSISDRVVIFPRIVLRVVVFEVFKIKRAFKVWVRFPHSPLR